LVATRDDDAVADTIPKTARTARATPAGQRKPEQAAALLEYYRYNDAEFWKHKQALAKVSEPLPADPKLTELQKALSRAEEPIRIDPYLVQLREDAVASSKQSQNKRLTVVQDLAGALINSSGFLFNH